MISDPTENIMIAELFLPIEENTFKQSTDEQLYFRSYFIVNPMIMTRIMENFDLQSQVKYWDLIHYIKQHNLQQKTPVFVEFKTNNQGDHFVEMSVGVE